MRQNDKREFKGNLLMTVARTVLGGSTGCIIPRQISCMSQTFECFNECAEIDV